MPSGRAVWVATAIAGACAGVLVGASGCSTREGTPPLDAGSRDAGGAFDAGEPRDAGAPTFDSGIRGDSGPVDAALDPDASCAVASATATLERLPVDIIWMVDNSSSMSPAIAEVTAGLNRFATDIEGRGLDYRVIMLALRGATPVVIGGSMRYPVCIPMPLAGDTACGDGPRFFQSSIDVRSTQPLEQFLGTLGQTAGYRMGEMRGGDPWRDHLRAEATKTIVVVTDDNARLSATDFEHFAGGTNPFNSTTLPPGILDPSWAGLFDEYTFDALYGWGSDTDPGVRCTFSDGTMPASPGPTYTTLVSTTGGVRARICDGASAWGPFFDAISTAVVRTARLECDVAIPPPPAGMIFDSMRINVAVVGAATTTALAKVRTGAAGCGAMGGWYYDSETLPTRVILCPASCDLAQTELRTGGTATVQVQFGCESILI